jgi:hypothetical protein
MVGRKNYEETKRNERRGNNRKGCIVSVFTDQEERSERCKLEKMRRKKSSK